MGSVGLHVWVAVLSAVIHTWVLIYFLYASMHISTKLLHSLSKPDNSMRATRVYPRVVSCLQMSLSWPWIMDAIAST